MPDAPQHDLPPYPWPVEPDPPPWEPCPPGGETCLGSFGTAWTFKASALRNRCVALGMGSEWDTLALLLFWANDRLSDWTSTSPICEETPEDPDPDPTLLFLSPLGAPRMSVNVYRAAVHATFGPFEDVEHVFHLRAKSGITQDTTEAGLQALAVRIGEAWSAFWDSQATYGGLGANIPTKLLFSHALAYDKITMSYLTYPGGWQDEDAKIVNPPVTVTPSTEWSFATPLHGAGETYYTLPSEVALCLTLLTDQAGKRTRGRVYLGGLTAALLQNAQADPAVQGFFDPLVRVVGFRFGTSIVDAIHDDAAAQAELNIVSRIGGSARGVGGVKVGLVPDSQRRRRWHMPENSTLVWGSA